MRNPLRRIIGYFFSFLGGNEIVKQQTVTYITRNDLYTIANVTTVERKRQQRLFRAWQKFKLFPQDSSSCTLSATGYSYAAVYDL